MGPTWYMDRGSESGRQSVASLCNAIVASIDGIECDTVQVVSARRSQRHAADFKGLGDA